MQLHSFLTSVSAQLHALAALPQGKEIRYPFNRRLDGPRNRSGRLRGEGLLTLPGIEHGFPDGPARGMVCRLSCAGDRSVQYRTQDRSSYRRILTVIFRKGGGCSPPERLSFSQRNLPHAVWPVVIFFGRNNNLDILRTVL